MKFIFPPPRLGRLLRLGALKQVLNSICETGEIEDLIDKMNKAFKEQGEI
jgi:hypothetical protein